MNLKLDPRFAFRFIANFSSAVREGSIELTEPRDYTQIRVRLHEILDSEYRAQNINEAIYDRVRGAGEEPQIRRRDYEGGGGRPEPPGEGKGDR
jgi:hypothetical protein